MAETRILIMGAAGRDFHNFNVAFREDEAVRVLAFTATQIPGIEGRTYPAALAGVRYPEGIPIEEESELVRLIGELEIDQVIFAYSDVSHETVMHKASQVLAAGADFRLLGAGSTQLESSKPVISVCAARTGCGKSQTTRHVARVLRDLGKSVVAVRHPMPYGDLAKQAVQRFGSVEDLKTHDCTIEEMEEYEPHIAAGCVVFAGVDYERILRKAEEEADVVLWDGGNNDLPFFQSDLEVVVVDPLRVGHESRYYPGESNVLSADVLVINKVDSAPAEAVFQLRENLRRMNPDAVVVEAASPPVLEDPSQVEGKRVVIVEDGPTLTHGEMAWGAGVAAARRYGPSAIVDPRPFAVGSIAETFERYPDTGAVLPAMGYGAAQVADLEATLKAADCDLVISATPIDLSRLVDPGKPILRVRYDLQEIGTPTLEGLLRERFG